MCFGQNPNSQTPTTDRSGNPVATVGRDGLPVPPPPKDPAQDILDREALRQSNILLGKGAIDKNFAQFDDGYYDKYKGAYKDVYLPQVDEQYSTAVGKMLAHLAGRGMDRSTVGAEAQGGLAKDYIKAKTTIAGEADSAANTLRGNVENAKSNLYAVNSAAADPAAANTQALAQAKTLVAPPTYSPIGEIFASAMGPINNHLSTQNNTPLREYQSPFRPRTPKTSMGSSQVIK